jgi:hypothetical protein
MKPHLLIIILLGSIALQFTCETRAANVHHASPRGSLASQSGSEAKSGNATAAVVIPDDGSSVAQVTLTLGNVGIIYSKTPIISFQVAIENLTGNIIYLVLDGLDNGADFFSVNGLGAKVEYKDSNPSGAEDIDSHGTRRILPGKPYLIKSFLPVSVIKPPNGKMAAMFRIFTLAADGSKKQYKIYSTPVQIPPLALSIIGANNSSASKAVHNDQGRQSRSTDRAGFTTVYWLDADGDAISRSILPPTNPEVLEGLQDSEAQFIQNLHDVEQDKSRSGLVQNRLQVLAMFYIYKMHDPAKALALAPQITDREILYLVKVIALNNDATLTDQEKITGYQKLIDEFPERIKPLNILINATTVNLPKNGKPGFNS